MIRPLLILVFIFSCFRIRTAPWNFFQLNASYFNSAKGIFSKFDINRLIPEQWRLRQYLEDGKTLPEAYPVFVKPEWGQNSHGVERVDSLEELHQVCQKVANKGVAYLVQEAAKEQREIEIFYIRSEQDSHQYSFLSITEVNNSGSERLPVNGVHNDQTFYSDLTPQFSDQEINTVWGLVKDIGQFRLARVGLRSNSKEDLLKGLFHIIEINIFLPMPLSLLDKNMIWAEKFRFVKKCMQLSAHAVRAIPDEQVRQSIFFKKLKVHYLVKS